MVSRSEELIFLGKSNPKLFWKELQLWNMETKNNIIASKWFDYARKLYEHDSKAYFPTLVNIDIELFTVQELEIGIKNLCVGK